MTEYVVRVEHTYETEMATDFDVGPIVDIKNGFEQRIIQKALVDKIKGVKIEIFSNEHPPPHFRVIYQGSTANFDIANCELLNGSGEVMKYQKNIKKWWKSNKGHLIDTWNSRRPSDCTVGEYRE